MKSICKTCFWLSQFEAKTGGPGHATSITKCRSDSQSKSKSKSSLVLCRHVSHGVCGKCSSTVPGLCQLKSAKQLEDPSTDPAIQRSTHPRPSHSSISASISMSIPHSWKVEEGSRVCACGLNEPKESNCCCTGRKYDFVCVFCNFLGKI